MTKRRICLHVWRVRQEWWSRTRRKPVYACSVCRRRWAAERKAGANW